MTKGSRGAKYEFSQRTVKRFHEAHVLMNARAHGIWIATADNAGPAEIGVSSYGGVASPEGRWAMRLDDAGSQIETYTIRL